MHFYVHSLPPSDPIKIPPPITIPLLQVSRQLRLPPLLTYSDNVLYNWRLESDDPKELPTISTMQCQSSFTSTSDEAEFYLVAARMELAGVEALDLMRSTMDEMFVGDDIAVRRIATYLLQLVDVIHHLCELLTEVKHGCDPNTFYHQVRPWLRGEDSQAGRKWVFEGIEQDPSLVAPTELSGPSAGQSTLIHALDIFLGTDQYSHGQGVMGHSPGASETSTTHTNKASFLQRMQSYMPRYHRAFLTHLSENSRLRDLVLSFSSMSDSSPSEDEDVRRNEGSALVGAYNTAVLALKEFRDAHMIIVALYIIGPSRRATPGESQDIKPGTIRKEHEPLRGTGGTDIVCFLKGVRDKTKSALIPQ